jgi:Superinfection immunity protein
MEILILLLLLFLPSVLALLRGNNNAPAVVFVNLFLGWTIIGWFVALMMAMGGGKKAQPVYVVAASQSYTPTHTPYTPDDWAGSRRLVPLNTIEGEKR